MAKVKTSNRGPVQRTASTNGVSDKHPSKRAHTSIETESEAQGSARKKVMVTVEEVDDDDHVSQDKGDEEETADAQLGKCIAAEDTYKYLI
jgi:hypothetical protein